jgi:hypothetical protein
MSMQFPAMVSWERPTLSTTYPFEDENFPAYGGVWGKKGEKCLRKLRLGNMFRAVSRMVRLIFRFFSTFVPVSPSWQLSGSSCPIKVHVLFSRDN